VSFFGASAARRAAALRGAARCSLGCCARFAGLHLAAMPPLLRIAMPCKRYLNQKAPPAPSAGSAFS